MTYVRPRSLILILALYVVGGLTVGFALPALKDFAAARFGRGGIAVAFVINVALPLLVVTLAAWYPRFSSALAGTFLSTLAFLAATGFVPPPLSSHWFRALIGYLGPILTVACVAYHLLAALTVVVLLPLRRVGNPPDPAACPGCGYLLIGINGGYCPECGGPARSRVGSEGSVGPRRA